MDIENTEATSALMRDFRKITQGTAALIQKMRQDVIYSDGIVPAKFKILGALLWSASTRCEPCVRWYGQVAAKHGVSEGELGEFLAVASTMGGCVGETWALKAYGAYRSYSGNVTAEAESCCH